MWNGFWKLTVMVGVVGIGLFAVFQAQNGMNRIASIPSSEDPSDGDSETADATNSSSILTREEPLVVDLDPSPKPPRTTTRRRAEIDNRIDLVRNLDVESSNVKQAVGSSNSKPHKFALASQISHQKGLSFQDDEDSFEASPPAPANIPQTLPDENSQEDLTTPASSPVRGSDDEAPSRELGAPETNSDPFEDQTKIPATREEPAETNATSRRKSLDFGDESEIPRSKRGIENSERQSGTEVEQEPNPFEVESKNLNAPPATDPENDPAEELPEPDSPSPPDTPMPSPSETTNPSVTPGADKTESTEFSQDRGVENKSRRRPDEIPDASDVDVNPRRSLPAVNRSKLPIDLDDEFTRNPPDRAREPKKLKAGTPPVMPADLIGDGVVGDSSQRGLQQPRLTIEKVAQQQAVVDQPLVYSIIVRNQGNVAAHHVVIEDRIPKGTELLGTSPRAELVGKTLVWKEQVLRPNEEKKISIKVVPKLEGPIGSVARVHFATEVSAEIQVASPPQLEFSVEAPGEVRIGQTFDLIFHLKNVGKVEASNISVRDLVPDLLRHDSGNDIECPIGKLAPNEVREIVLPVIATKTGSGLNRAILTADSGIQKQLDSTIDVVSDNLVLTRSGHNRVYVERSAVFTNTIRNDGRMPASKVRVLEIVPTGMEFEAASDGGKYDQSQNAVVWTVGALAPGDDRVLTVKYVAKETGTHSGRITATGASGSTAVIQSKVEVVGRPEIQMETLSATGVVNIGDRITSKFQLKNAGTAVAKNVQLRIQLPTELRVLSARGAKFQKEKNLIIFDPIEEMPPHSSSSFELILEPTEEADARVVVEIFADHLTKPHRREESMQIVKDSLK